MTYSEHASNLWPILVELAKARCCETYGQIGKRLDLNAQNVSGALAPIHAYCETNELPLLTALVVQARKGRPGPGYQCANDHAIECAKVYDHNWSRVPLPSAATLSKA